MNPNPDVVAFYLLYANLSHGTTARGGTSPDAVEMRSSGPWPETEINTASGDEGTTPDHRPRE